MVRTLVCTLLLAAAPAAVANYQLALDEGSFAEQRSEIEKGLADGKTYAEISQADRAKVRESLERISGRLEGVESVDSLSEPAKVAVFNDQELINTILTQAEADSRMVCTRTARTGSHRKTNECQTVAERRRRQELDQENLQKMQKGRMPLSN
ncbi:hypothetical protein [Arenimonas sp. MALMAid1274]|uniref:hypothetical protein n=1 Tax=Arenimonas sp. MALMAid1274 TaxID=3411630 RepID=UPI003B9F2F84